MRRFFRWLTGAAAKIQRMIDLVQVVRVNLNSIIALMTPEQRTAAEQHIDNIRDAARDIKRLF